VDSKGVIDVVAKDLLCVVAKATLIVQAIVYHQARIAEQTKGFPWMTIEKTYREMAKGSFLNVELLEPKIGDILQGLCERKLNRKELDAAIDTILQDFGDANINFEDLWEDNSGKSIIDIVDSNRNGFAVPNYATRLLGMHSPELHNEVIHFHFSHDLLTSMDLLPELQTHLGRGRGKNAILALGKKINEVANRERRKSPTAVTAEKISAVSVDLSKKGTTEQIKQAIQSGGGVETESDNVESPKGNSNSVEKPPESNELNA
jgi:hypothetical protein